VFTLRKYEPRDFDRLVEIDQACFVEGIAYDTDEMRHYLSMPSTFTIVGITGGRGEIRGFIIADRFQSRRASRLMGRIITIDVLPETQHTGLGTLLLSQAENELKQAGCDYVSLEVAVDNASALRFYKKHGYSVLKILPNYYPESIDGLLMGKKL
jgi:[ribosomal protein S18]-alanine N-acetyltransferase